MGIESRFLSRLGLASWSSPRWGNDEKMLSRKLIWFSKDGELVQALGKNPWCEVSMMSLRSVRRSSLEAWLLISEKESERETTLYYTENEKAAR